MRVAFFNRAYFPERSSTAQLLQELAEGLAQNHGCCVTVVAGRWVGERSPGRQLPRGWAPVREEQVGPVRVLRAVGTCFSKRTLAGRIANYLSYFSSACLAAFRLERPDIVIALTDPPVIGLAALLAGARFRCPVVLSYRDLFPEAARLLDGRRRPFIDATLNGVNRVLIRRCARLIALGEAMRECLIRTKGARPERVQVIPDWADTASILPGPKNNPFSREQRLQDRFVVMHSGNIGGAQELDVLLDAAAGLKDLPLLTVAIVGEGVRKAGLQARASEMGLTQVRFFPLQPKERLPQSFASADCFVVSTPPGLAGIVTPSKLYGILAAGRPYVAAVDEQCDVARITRRYECGLLVPAGDSKGLAEKIRTLYNDAGLARRLGERGRRAALDFGRGKGVQAYYEMCRELTGKT